MARKPRIFIPGASVHIIHRGNNRGPIVRDDEDREVLLTLLRRASERYALAVHGYVVMDTHYHLMVMPTYEGCLSAAMKELGERYVGYFNYRHRRSGTLWNGRFRDLPVLDERYWLTCLRYIELNPVRANMVASPEMFRWSSYRHHAMGEEIEWLTLHSLYLALGPTPAERQLAYRTLCESPVTRAEMLAQRLAWRRAQRDGDRTTDTNELKFTLIRTVTGV